MTTAGKLLVIVLAVLAAMVLVAPALPGGAMGPGMMWGYGGPWGWGFAGAGWEWGLAFGMRALTMLAFWGATAAGIVLLVRWLSDRDRHEHRG